MNTLTLGIFATEGPSCLMAVSDSGAEPLWSLPDDEAAALVLAWCKAAREQSARERETTARRQSLHLVSALVQEGTALRSNVAKLSRLADSALRLLSPEERAEALRASQEGEA